MEIFKNAMIGIIGVAVGVIFLLWVIIAMPSSIIIDYYWENEINSYFELSDQASTLDKKLEYMKQYKQALIDHGLDKGDARYVFKTPQTKLETQMKVLDTLIERMESAKKMDTASLEYQQAIKQITTDEYQGFNTCLFGDGYQRQNFWRWVFGYTGCQNGHYSGENSGY